LVPLATTMSTPFCSGGTLNAHGDAMVVSSTNLIAGAVARARLSTSRKPSKSCARTSGLVNVSANTNLVSGRIASASAVISPSSTIVTEALRRAASHSR
jgi:hypothetical protein